MKMLIIFFAIGLLRVATGVECAEPKPGTVAAGVARGTAVEPESSPLKDNLPGKLGFDEMLVIKRHHLKTSHVYTYHVDGFIPGGGLYAFSPSTGKVREVVNAGQGEILDCDLSFDGKEILFTWKRQGKPIRDVAACGLEHSLASSKENYQIFRVNLDGTGLTQLTDDASNNLSPRWLPDGGILFTSDRRPAFAYCWVSSSPILHRMERDGSHVTKLSSSYLMDFTPCILDDGRILYTRWEYVDRPAIPIQGLWTMRPDGTGVSGFYGNRVLSPATFMQSQPIPNTGKLLCLLTSHGGDPRGAIGIIDPSHGGNAQAGIFNCTPEINIGRVDEGDGEILRNTGPYETPFPIDEHRYLVSRAGEIQLRAYDNSRPAATLLPKPSGSQGYYSPVPVKPRPIPPVVPRRQATENADSWATIFLANVYNGLEPHVKRGEVKKICVVEEVAKTTFAPVQSRAFGFQFPLVSCGATYAPKKVWGFVDVAADGSAYFKAPANRPVYFLALDAEGRAVQRMRTFTHFMPGEQQGCVGCHADRNYMAATSAQPLRGQTVQPLQPPSWGVNGFS